MTILLCLDFTIATLLTFFYDLQPNQLVLTCYETQLNKKSLMLLLIVTLSFFKMCFITLESSTAIIAISR